MTICRANKNYSALIAKELSCPRVIPLITPARILRNGFGLSPTRGLPAQDGGWTSNPAIDPFVRRMTSGWAGVSLAGRKAVVESEPSLNDSYLNHCKPK